MTHPPPPSPYEFTPEQQHQLRLIALKAALEHLQNFFVGGAIDETHGEVDEAFGDLIAKDEDDRLDPAISTFLEKEITTLGNALEDTVQQLLGKEEAKGVNRDPS